MRNSSLAASGGLEQQVLHVRASQAQENRTSQVPPLHLYTQPLFLHARTHREQEVGDTPYPV